MQGSLYKSRLSILAALIAATLPVSLTAAAEALPNASTSLSGKSQTFSSSPSPLPQPATDNDFVLPELSVPGSTNVTQVVQRTLFQNPEVRASWNAIQASGNDAREAWGGFLPTVNLSGGAGRESQSNDGEGSYETDYYELTLQQMLFDGFETSSQVDRFQHIKRQNYFDFLDTSEQAALNAYQAYLDVMRYRDLVSLARGNYAQHLTVFDQIEQRARSGAGRGVDLEQITGRLALAESNLMTEAANLHDVVARYQRIVGELPPRQLAPLPELEKLMPPSVEVALQEAMNSNPQIYSAYENRMAQRANQDVREAAFYPDLSLQASTGRNNEDSTFGERRNQTTVQLVGSINLYRGGSDVAAWRAAGDRLEQSWQQQEQACHNVRQTTQIAYRDAVRYEEQLRYLNEHRQSIDRIRVPYQQQFELGQRTLLDLLDNENEYFESSRDYVDGWYDQRLAFARTLAATSRLISALQVSHLETADLVDEVKPENISADMSCGVTSPGGFTLDELTQGLRSDVRSGMGSSQQTQWPETGSFDVEPLQ
ncbi:TolC family outer membrane protein [Kushneria aurantia]|uniref:TolC family outer membrane protein n=1 Tax=Kushneria aurantia TaxID=504092 RepID=A0ABV6G6L0_9GAMM|nr:TolC family outer membrane protein [Kushneria aurantia]